MKIFAFLQRLLGDFAWSHIDHHADHSLWPARGVALQSAASFNPAHRVAGADDAMLDRAPAHVALEDATVEVGDTIDVRRMNEAQEILVHAAEFSRAQLKHRLCLRRRAQHAAGDVPLPDAGTGRVECERQPALATLKFLLSERTLLQLAAESLERAS